MCVVSAGHHYDTNVRPINIIRSCVLKVSSSLLRFVKMDSYQSYYHLLRKTLDDHVSIVWLWNERRLRLQLQEKRVKFPADANQFVVSVDPKRKATQS